MTKVPARTPFDHRGGKDWDKEAREDRQHQEWLDGFFRLPRQLVDIKAEQGV